MALALVNRYLLINQTNKLLKKKIAFILSLFTIAVFSVSKIEAASSCPGPNGRLPINSSSCFANVLLKCSSTGVVNYTVCTYGCSDNACKEKTNPGTLSTTCTTPNGKIPINTSTCFAKALYKCSNSATLSYTNCTYGCSDNTCRGKNDGTPTPTPKPTPTLIPTPIPTLRPTPTPKLTTCSFPMGSLSIGRTFLYLNESSCFANTLFSCPSPGAFSHTDCQFGCTNNACRTASQPCDGGSLIGDIPVGESVCYINIVKKCLANGNVETTACQYGCSNNSCNPPPSCSQKSGTCLPSFLCMGNNYVTGDSCGIFSCCAPRPTECAAPGHSIPLNSSNCHLNTIYSCSSTGQLTYSGCPYGYGCQEGNNACNTAPTMCFTTNLTIPVNQSKCQSNIIYKCLSSGQISAINCSNGCQSDSVCNPGSVPTACTVYGNTLPVNTSGCFTNLLYNCSSTGLLTYVSCANGCINGSSTCKPTPTQAPTPTITVSQCSAPGGILNVNNSRCMFNAIFKCTSNGLVTTNCTYGCESDYACYSSPHDCFYYNPDKITIALNTASCDKTIVRHCSINGQYSITECPYGCIPYTTTCKTSPTDCSISGVTVPMDSFACISNVLWNCSKNGIPNNWNCAHGCLPNSTTCAP